MKTNLRTTCVGERSRVGRDLVEGPTSGQERKRGKEEGDKGKMEKNEMKKRD